jgi:hypothetical protein
MPLLRPRSIRGQFMAALILFEIIVVGIFTLLLLRQQKSEMDQRMHRRLENQAFQMASLGTLALADRNPRAFAHIVTIVAKSASVSAAQITDLNGLTLASTDPTSVGKITLSTKEKSFLHHLSEPVMFRSTDQGSSVGSRHPHPRQRPGPRPRLDLSQRPSGSAGPPFPAPHHRPLGRLRPRRLHHHRRLPRPVHHPPARPPHPRHAPPHPAPRRSRRRIPSPRQNLHRSRRTHHRL